MSDQSLKNSQMLGQLIGKVEAIENHSKERHEMIVRSLLEIHDDLKETKQDLRSHIEKDEKFYEKVNSIDGNQKKMMGIAAGIAAVVGLGADKIKAMFGG